MATLVMHLFLQRSIVTSKVWLRYATKVPLTLLKITRTPPGYKLISRSSRMSSRLSCIGGILSTVSALFFGCLRSILNAHLGELRVMFAQEDIYSGYMDKFFAEHNHPIISWVHDLGMGRHGAASQTLLSESQGASDIHTKHVRTYFYIEDRPLIFCPHSSCLAWGNSHS